METKENMTFQDLVDFVEGNKGFIDAQAPVYLSSVSAGANLKQFKFIRESNREGADHTVYLVG